MTSSGVKRYRIVDKSGVENNVHTGLAKPVNDLMFSDHSNLRNCLYSGQILEPHKAGRVKVQFPSQVGLLDDTATHKQDMTADFICRSKGSKKPSPRNTETQMPRNDFILRNKEPPTDNSNLKNLTTSPLRIKKEVLENRSSKSPKDQFRRIGTKSISQGLRTKIVIETGLKQDSSARTPDADARKRKPKLKTQIVRVEVHQKPDEHQRLQKSNSLKKKTLNTSHNLEFEKNIDKYIKLMLKKQTENYEKLKNVKSNPSLTRSRKKADKLFSESQKNINKSNSRSPMKAQGQTRLHTEEAAVKAPFEPFISYIKRRQDRQKRVACHKPANTNPQISRLHSRIIDNNQTGEKNKLIGEIKKRLAQEIKQHATAAVYKPDPNAMRNPKSPNTNFRSANNILINPKTDSYRKPASLSKLEKARLLKRSQKELQAEESNRHCLLSNVRGSTGLKAFTQDLEPNKEPLFVLPIDRLTSSCSAADLSGILGSHEWKPPADFPPARSKKLIRRAKSERSIAIKRESSREALAPKPKPMKKRSRQTSPLKLSADVPKKKQPEDCPKPASKGPAEANAGVKDLVAQPPDLLYTFKASKDDAIKVKGEVFQMNDFGVTSAIEELNTKVDQMLTKLRDIDVTPRAGLSKIDPFLNSCGDHKRTLRKELVRPAVENEHDADLPARQRHRLGPKKR